MNEIKRVETLDYLRGILALSVLIYHYFMFENIRLFYPLNNLDSRLGIYAVSGFYVLSGTTLALVYLNKVVNKGFLKTFTIKRILRIAPLFYIATTLTILITLVLSFKNHDFSKIPSVMDILLNYSLTFGWIDHTHYIATGAWSIGNELVFYSVFPIMLLLVNKSIKLYISFLAITMLVTLFFSFFLLDNQIPLAKQWGRYINPINQLYLFAGGFLIGWLYKVKRIRVNQRLLVYLLIASVVVFIFLPTNESQISFVTGYAKVIFPILIFIMCFCVMFMKIEKSNCITKILKYFGDISYSIYLLHPVAYSICSIGLKIIGLNNSIIQIIMSFLVALIMATGSYYIIEKRFMNLGKRNYQQKALSA